MLVPNQHKGRYIGHLINASGYIYNNGGRTIGEFMSLFGFDARSVLIMDMTLIAERQKGFTLPYRKNTKPLPECSMKKNGKKCQKSANKTAGNLTAPKRR